MIQASAKNVVRAAIALGAFALAALVAAPDATRSAAGDFGGEGTPTPAPKPAFPFAPAPTPKAVLDFGANGKAAVPNAVSKPSIKGKENLSPDIFGGAKMPPVYDNLEASLENAAVLAAAGAGGAMGSADAAMNAEMVANAVSQTPLNDGADAVAVSVYAASDISDAKRFLENRGVRIDYSGETWLEAYVPARLLGALSERAGVIRVEPIIPPVVDQAPTPSFVPDQDPPPSPSPSPTPTPGPCATDTTIGSISTSTTTVKTGTWKGLCDSLWGRVFNGSVKRYEFSLPQAAAIAIDLATDTDVDPFLYLRSGRGPFGRGDYIARDDNGGGGTSARVIRALAAGTYTLEAAGAGSAHNNAFTLTLTSDLATICRETLDISSSPTAKTASWASGCDSAANPRSYARFYTFTLSARTETAIELTTPDATATVPKADARLYLRSGRSVSGAVVAESDDMSETPLRTDSRIERTLDAGEYTVEATTHLPRTAGSFTLTVTRAAARAGCAPTALGTLAAASTSALTANGAGWPANCDSAAKTNSQSAYYGFTLSEPATVEISLSSSAAGADPFLYLRSGARNFGTAIASDDDGGTGSAAFIRRALEAGEYTVEATSQTASASGTFDLSIAPLADCRVDLGTLGASEDINGIWRTACESVDRAPLYARFYTFTLASDSRADIFLSSEEADTYMYLRRGSATSGASVAVNDDVGHGVNSFISENLAAGTYTIEATEFDSQIADAQFRISISLPNDCAAAAFGTLEPATTIADGRWLSYSDAPSATADKFGRWSAGCGSRARSGSYARFYTFSLKERAEATISLKASGSADAYLHLRDGDGTLSGASIAEDDDGGDGYDSRISRTLEAGSYTVEATTARRSQEDGFTLRVTLLPIIGCAAAPLGELAAATAQTGTLPSGCYFTPSEGTFNQYRSAQYGWARFYTFSLTSRTKVSIDLSSNASSRLHLREGDGTLTGTSIAELNSVLTPASPIARYKSNIRRALDAGTYTVEVASPARFWTTFNLTLTPTAPVPCAAPAPLGALSAAATQSGTWSSNCFSEARPYSYARFYTFTLSADANVDVSLESATDSYASVRAGDGVFEGAVVARAESGEEAVAALLRAGTYTVEAASAADAAAGDFALKLAAAPITVCAATALALADGETTTASNQSWTSGCDSARAARSYAKRYSFTLDAPRLVKIELVSRVAADTRLYLTRGESAAGTEHVGEDPPAGAGDALPTRASRIERVLDAGTYTVEALAKRPRVLGAFTLSATASAPITARTADAADSCLKNFGAIAAASDATDAWEWSADCQDADGNATNRATFTLSEPARVSLGLFAHALNAGARLKLSRQSADYVSGGSAPRWEKSFAEDEGVGGARLSAALEAGTYRAELLPGPASATGGFGFWMRGAATTCDPDELGELASGEIQRTGTWAEDCESGLRVGSYARRYTFSLAQDSNVTIGLASDAANPYLYLRTSATSTAPIIAQNDDGGDGTDARITASLSASAAAPYVVEATTNDRAEGGAFTLTIDAAPTAKPPPAAPTACETEDMGEIRTRATRTGTWSDDCSPSPGWSAPARSARLYGFTLAERSFVSIDASAAGGDPIIALRTAGGAGATAIEEDDDHGVGLRSRIRRVMDPGDYSVEVGEFRKASGREFTLAVSATPVEASAAAGCETALGTIGRVPGSVPRSDSWSRECPGYSKFYSFTLEKPARVNFSARAGMKVYLRLKRAGESANVASVTVRSNRPDWIAGRYLAAGSYELEVEPNFIRAAPGAPFTFVISVEETLGDGPSVHNSAAWNAMGHTGAGVKVGVIDQGFLGNWRLRGVELPSDHDPHCLTGSAYCHYGVHGTAVSEAIHDIAPDAELYLAGAGSRGSLSAAVDRLMMQGVDIVNMSLSFSWDGSPNGDSLYENSMISSVDRAVRSGVVWLNSAGNNRASGWGGEFSDSDGDGLMEFADGDETNSLADFASQLIEMRWDDDWGGADTDLDIYLLDSRNRVVASSINRQTGNRFTNGGRRKGREILLLLDASKQPNRRPRP